MGNIIERRRLWKAQMLWVLSSGCCWKRWRRKHQRTWIWRWFDDSFLDFTLTNYGVNNDDPEKQLIHLPTIPELRKEQILKNLNEIREVVKKKVIHWRCFFVYGWGSVEMLASFFILIMGYLSNFYIKFENLKDFSDEEKENILEEIVGNVDYLEHYIDDNDFYSDSKIDAYDLKWYEYQDDLVRLSKLLPKLKFYVDVYGESDGDIQTDLLLQWSNCQIEKGNH